MIRYLHAFLPMPCSFLPQVVSVALPFALSTAVVEFSYFLPMMVLVLRLIVFASFTVPGCFD